MSGDPKKKPTPPRATPPRVASKTITGTPGAARFDALIHSAYLDSLEQLTGRPSVYAYGTAPVDRAFKDPAQQWAAAQYTFHDARGLPRRMGADTVTLAPALLERNALGDAPRPADEQRTATSPEYALAHELGHRSRIVAAMVNGGQDRSAVRQEQDSTYDKGIADAGPPQVGTGDPYWMANEHEHHAEAFANGVQFLRATAGMRADPDELERAAPTMARYEQAVPGTARMVSRLLQHPLYANHPILRAMLPQRAAADATSVRAPSPPTPGRAP